MTDTDLYALRDARNNVHHWAQWLHDYLAANNQPKYEHIVPVARYHLERMHHDMRQLARLVGPMVAGIQTHHPDPDVMNTRGT